MGAILLAIDPSGTDWFTVALCVVLAALAFFVIVKLKGEALQHFNVVVAVVVATLIVAGTVALLTVTGGINFMTIAGILVVVLPWCYWPRQGTRRRVILNAYRVGFALPATPCLAVIVWMSFDKITACPVRKGTVS